ncbi:MAG: hypothetical protein CMF59_13925 [Leptospiraceae bacterium]|nr:hypothetical protein [Leptospiraceae bacterium]
MRMDLLRRSTTGIGILILCIGSCISASSKEPLETVNELDLVKYLGTWQELYRIPNSFQDGEDPCMDTTATYRRRKDGKIVVLNRCQRSTGTDEATGLAYVPNPEDNSRLKMNFTGIWLLRAIGIGDGNYYVLGLGPVEDRQYAWALVGEPGRKYGWILSRSSLNPKTITRIFEIAEEQGYSRDQFKSFRTN